MQLSGHRGTLGSRRDPNGIGSGKKRASVAPTRHQLCSHAEFKSCEVPDLKGKPERLGNAYQDHSPCGEPLRQPSIQLWGAVESRDV